MVPFSRSLSRPLTEYCVPRRTLAAPQGNRDNPKLPKLHVPACPTCRARQSSRRTGVLGNRFGEMVGLLACS